MEFIIQFIVALFATLSFAVIFSAPKKELFYCGFTGALGWIIYYIMVQFDMGVVCPEQEFFTRHIIFLRMTEHFPPQRVLKPLRWQVPSCLVSYSGLAYRRVCLIC